MGLLIEVLLPWDPSSHTTVQSVETKNAYMSGSQSTALAT